jgi:hypothetical protein
MSAFEECKSRFDETRLSSKPSHRPKSAESVERFHEVTFSSVVGTLRSFVAKEEVARGPSRPLACGKGG